MEQLTWESLKGKYLQPEGHFSIHMSSADLEIIQEGVGGWKALEQTLAQQHKRIWLTDVQRYFPMTLTDHSIVNSRMFGDPYKGYWKVSEQEMICAMDHHGSSAAVMKLAQEHDVHFYIWDARGPEPENGPVSLKVIQDLRDALFQSYTDTGYGALGSTQKLIAKDIGDFTFHMDGETIFMSPSDSLVAQIHHRDLPIIVVGAGPGLHRLLHSKESGDRILINDDIRFIENHSLSMNLEVEGIVPRNRRERRSKGLISESKYKRGEWWNR